MAKALDYCRFFAKISAWFGVRISPCCCCCWPSFSLSCPAVRPGLVLTIPILVNGDSLAISSVLRIFISHSHQVSLDFMDKTFDWEFIKAAKLHVRLDLLDIELANVRDDLYRLGPQEYVIVNRYLLAKKPGGNYFGVIFFWAPSVGTALRAAERDTSQDDGGTSQPPTSLLIDGWRWTHSDILAACANEQLGPFRARPFVRTHGHFIGRVIHAGIFSYYFRDQSDPLEIRSWCRRARNQMAISRLTLSS